ncbi:DNA polymerase beta superfamily protein [Paenibacillus methanolicus]|uniref:Putative nucleotidyltransferase n=1 Tax=Paenibacillus methanolicus TaxID=582686 RepID=A0A5S5CI68_9BACL|nr:nucleotidyltransferase domain-containing protein [Paenibacillus methanolicus]TYP79224.1 putative nucleotidyltransferase [Paenibacillus methanolicus]
MLDKAKRFIADRTGSADLADGLIYVCQAGSVISGTNDETSDLDYRGIVFLDANYFLGLKSFEHTKLVGGTGKINAADDLDIELFSPRHFIKEAYHGEIVPFEMMYVSERFQLLRDDRVLPILEARELFLSKALVKRYIGFIKGCCKRALVPADSLKRPDKIARAERYGYETKEAMNAIKCARLMIELLDTGDIRLYRRDREDLLEIKRGKYKRDEYLVIIDDLIAEAESKLHANAKLGNMPDFDQVNAFLKDYTMWLYKLGWHDAAGNLS